MSKSFRRDVALMKISSALVRVLSAGMLATLPFWLSAGLLGQTPPPGASPAANFEELRCPHFTLEDQDQASHAVTFPRSAPLVLLIGDRESRKRIPPWVEVLCTLGIVPDAKVPPEHKQKSDAAKAAAAAGKKTLPEADLFGVADLRGVPDAFMWLVRKTGKGDYKHPVLLDQKGVLCAPLKLEDGVVRICVIDGEGVVVAIVTGEVDEKKVEILRLAFERIGKSLPKGGASAVKP